MKVHLLAVIVSLRGETTARLKVPGKILSESDIFNKCAMGPIRA